MTYLGCYILRAAQTAGINPFNTPFAPKDLGLIASDYGSFSDLCEIGDTKSAIHNIHVCLKVAERNDKGQPLRYILLPISMWK